MKFLNFQMKLFDAFFFCLVVSIVAYSYFDSKSKSVTKQKTLLQSSYYSIEIKTLDQNPILCSIEPINPWAIIIITPFGTPDQPPRKLDEYFMIIRDKKILQFFDGDLLETYGHTKICCP